MRRYIYILLLWLSLPLIAGIHTYTDQSVLSTGKWVKIRVSETGVCRMSFSQLRDAGLTPEQLRVFGYGGGMLDQNFLHSHIDDLPQVPVYVGNDYVLFWVQGPVKWIYNGSRFEHTTNPYSLYGYYLLSDDAGELLPMTIDEENSNATPTDVSTYLHYQVHELDSLNLVDRSGVSGGGREFYGEQFNSAQKRVFRFNTPNALAGESSYVVVDVAAKSSVVSYFQPNINGQNMSSIRIAATPSSDFYSMANVGNGRMNSSSVADQQTVQLTYQGSASGSLGWLNYIEITTPSALTMTGSWMPIRSTVNYKTNTPVRYHLSGATAETQIWDVTDGSRIVRKSATMTGNELVWTGTQADGIHEYVAVTPGNNGFVSARTIGSVANQNLHALRNIDYVIICPEGYESIAEDLARAHEQKEGITWAVVTDQQVYNEFSSGTPDATAYRWLMKMLYDRADGINQKPRWLLLMGHGTFDNRKLLSNSGMNTLLCYEAKNSTNEVEAYATDDYFTFLDDSEGETDTDGRMDIGVGRLPVGSTDEASEMVDKLIRYILDEHPGKWKQQLIFLADDGDKGSHTETAEAGAEKVRLKNPDFVVHKIYLDAYPQEVNASGESYPLAKNRLENLLKNGALFFDYSGHGGYNAITNESMLNLKDIESMTNKNHAFWLFATCNFGQFDSGKRCAAESAVLNPIGGAIGVLAATRTVYATENTKLNYAICDTLFGHSDVFHYEMTIGEAIAAGKNELTQKNINKLPYILFGDPALHLQYPTSYQVNTTTVIDTLHALSIQEVDGEIIDEDSIVVDDFNGKVNITVYDKLQVIETRDNDDKTGEVEIKTYNDYPNTLFTGSADVTDGRFRYSFMVPKDIRYNYGPGRIVYYAYTDDSLALAEAVGHNEQFIIGGTGSILIVDTVGPQMTIYLNTAAFRDGGRTNETPRFFADLYDEHGINTAGSGIGHDLMLIVDDDPKMTYSLNEYFTAANSSYQAGQVSYLMEKLENGSHSLMFRAWDLMNNSTTQTLNFIVEAGLDPSIYRVVTYPNPVSESGMLNLVVQYDQPDEARETEITFYDLSGRLVWRHTQDSEDQIRLNLAHIGLNCGVYTFSVSVRSVANRYCRSTGKIIVTK